MGGLVYIAAYAGDTGECVGTLNQRFPVSAGAREIRADADGYLTIHADAFPVVFAGDVDPVQARVLAAVQKPTAAACFSGVLDGAACHAAPSWYLIAGADEMIPVEAERWMAERIDATVRVVPSSHTLPVSHPHDVLHAVEAATKQAVPATAGGTSIPWWRTGSRRRA